MKYEVDMLPQHMREGVLKYLDQHIRPGGFLYAVLCNDLVGATLRADPINKTSLDDWVQWLLGHCPSYAWGSTEIVEAWIANKEDLATAQFHQPWHRPE